MLSLNARRLFCASLMLNAYASTAAFADEGDSARGIADEAPLEDRSGYGLDPVELPQAILVQDGSTPTADDGPAIENQAITGIEVIFIRHGESEWNVKKKTGGKNDTADVLLTVEGVRDATAARDALRPVLAGKTVALLTSNLARAQLTGVIATDAAVNPSITSSMQEVSGGKDAESNIAAYVVRTLVATETANMKAAGLTDAQVAQVTAKYAAADKTDSKGNHALLARAFHSYLDHFPKYVVKAYNRVKTGPYKIVLAGHSHWWNAFAKAYDRDNSCTNLGHPNNGQAISFKLNTEVKKRLIGGDKLVFTIDSCTTLVPGRQVEEEPIEG